MGYIRRPTSDTTFGDSYDTVVQKARPKTKRPSLYKVILMNDDFTPMDFVVHVLQKFFQMNQSTATQLMLQIHTQGKGVCGVFSKEIAEAKVTRVNRYSQEQKHPLLCMMEKD